MAESDEGKHAKLYLALGDSMSIDHYTGVAGGGAVSQFYKSLGSQWDLNDQAFDGCTIAEVPRTLQGDLITLTIGGNDALVREDQLARNGVGEVLKEHLGLLEELRNRNPASCLIVGNIYRPKIPLRPRLLVLFDKLSEGIWHNVARVGGCLADIRAAFEGHEDEYLCHQIEPSLQGATAIATLFEKEYKKWLQTAASR